MNPKNPKTDKNLPKECWINSCHNRASHHYLFGGKDWFICDRHFKAIKKQEEIEKEKKEK